MKKIILAIAIISLNGFLLSCTNQDDKELELYDNSTELLSSGGEEEQNPPPPPPPPPPGDTGN